MDEMCLELQHSEMEALAAVYTADSGDSFTFSTAADGTISGSIDIEVAADVCMQFTEMAHNDSTQLATGIDWQKVECLPPIRLDFTLPAAYPSDMPPQTSLSCCWLSETALAAVQQELSDIWTAEQGMCVLGLFIDYIQHDLKPSSTIRICLGSDQLAAERHVALILEYGNPKQKLCFESQAHMCPICMEEQSGLHCMQLSCTHVFCHECLRGYLSVLVREGDIMRLICPHEDCRKQTAQTIISDIELEQLVSSQEMARIRRLREQRLVETDGANYAACPRPSCGRTVKCDKAVKHLCICDCGYVFCKACQNTWHGVNDCPVKIKKDSLELYRQTCAEALRLYKQACAEEAEGGTSEARMKLEKQFEAIIKEHFRLRVEEAKSTEYIAENTISCPRCDMPIQKSYGCNHMRCSRCSTHFCYLCGEATNQSDPLLHFKDTNSRCKGRMFEFVEESNNGNNSTLEAEQAEANMIIQLALEELADECDAFDV